jgi:hypothetical protein
MWLLCRLSRRLLLNRGTQIKLFEHMHQLVN